MINLVVYIGEKSEIIFSTIKKTCKNSQVVNFVPGNDVATSLTTIDDAVQDMLLEQMNEDGKLIFAGSGIGAWYAKKLSELYRCESVLVNPIFNPSMNCLEPANYYAMNFCNPEKAHFIISGSENIDSFNELPSVIRNNLNGTISNEVQSAPILAANYIKSLESTR